MIDIDSVLSRGQKLADEVEIFVAGYDDLAVEQREMAVSSVFEHSGQNIYIRVVKNGKMGVSATSDPTKLDSCLRSAVSSANLADVIPNWNGFTQKSEIPAGKDPVDANLEITPETAMEYLQRMNAGAEKYNEARVVTGGVTLTKGSSILANSNGVYLERKFTDISLGMDAICEGSTGYDNDSSPFSNRINPEAIGEHTTYFATASRNGKTIESGKYDVVFSEDVVDSLVLELFTEAVNGKNVMTGQSIYAGKLNETVTSPKITIRDEPQNPAGDAWRRFDSEGTPSRALDIVKDGVLQTFLYDAKTAAQTGSKNTGHAHRAANGTTIIGPHCLTVDAPKGNVLGKPCMYIKEVIGAHTANPLTGEFSVEVANAFLAEGGTFKEPVKKAMIAGNIFDILNGDILISPEVKAMQGALVPMMRISDLQVI